MRTISARSLPSLRAKPQNPSRRAGEMREAEGVLALVMQRPSRKALRHPARGIFTCISPWNFPLAIFTGQIAGAHCGRQWRAGQTRRTDAHHRAITPRACCTRPACRATCCIAARVEWWPRWGPRSPSDSAGEWRGLHRLEPKTAKSIQAAMAEHLGPPAHRLLPKPAG